MTVGVVGLGLIGGSIGLALREPDRLIVGFEPNEANARTALDRFCVDAVEPLEQVAQADVVFVAAPPAKVIDVLEQIRTLKRPDTVVTDCTSVKAIVADWAEKTQDPMFVPGHPMAGHEKSGPAFASAWMFRDARWILSPLEITSREAVQTVENLVRAMGAVPFRVSALRHDRHVAVVSHLPHALAGILVQLAEGLEDGDIAGGSWRDLTRVGGVDPTLWTQIFLGNREELVRALGEMSKRLAQLEADIAKGDETAVTAFFEEAQRAKARHKPKGSSAPKPAPQKTQTRRRG